jgi:hypothetical protein
VGVAYDMRCKRALANGWNEIGAEFSLRPSVPKCGYSSKNSRKRQHERPMRVTICISVMHITRVHVRLVPTMTLPLRPGR